jgi:hypothetical protein
LFDASIITIISLPATLIPGMNYITENSQKYERQFQNIAHFNKSFKQRCSIFQLYRCVYLSICTFFSVICNKCSMHLSENVHCKRMIVWKCFSSNYFELCCESIAHTKKLTITSFVCFNCLKNNFHSNDFFTKK